MIACKNVKQPNVVCKKWTSFLANTSWIQYSIKGNVKSCMGNVSP